MLPEAEGLYQLKCFFLSCSRVLFTPRYNRVLHRQQNIAILTFEGVNTGGSNILPNLCSILKSAGHNCDCVKTTSGFKIYVQRLAALVCPGKKNTIWDYSGGGDVAIVLGYAHNFRIYWRSRSGLWASKLSPSDDVASTCRSRAGCSNLPPWSFLKERTFQDCSCRDQACSHLDLEWICF